MVGWIVWTLRRIFFLSVFPLKRIMNVCVRMAHDLSEGTISPLGTRNQTLDHLWQTSHLLLCGYNCWNCQSSTMSHVLRELGQAISPILLVDMHTTSEIWGRFARLCVQINFDKPLIKLIRTGGIEQPVLYRE